MEYDEATANAYAQNRDASTIVIQELREIGRVTASSKVLEVGCGTASHLRRVLDATGCRGWGVDPSSEMRSRAVPHEHIQLLAGTAESLPCDDEFLDLVFSVDVIHQVEDHVAHYQEAKRVLAQRGMICTVTDSHEMILSRKPLSQCWPSSAAADVVRYPTVQSLLETMANVGFLEPETHCIRTPFVLTDTTPYRAKAFSCLHMISDAEFVEGLRRLEEDLRNGPMEGVMQYACVWGRIPADS